jgi:hypothetical protein
MTNKIKELPPFPFKFTVNIHESAQRVYTATQHPHFEGCVQVNWDEDSTGNGTWYRKEHALRTIQMGDWQLVETPKVDWQDTLVKVSDKYGDIYSISIIASEDLLNQIKQFSQAGHEVAIHNGKYRVFPKGECFAYKCDNDEALVKTMEALSHLDSLEVE